MPNVGGWYLHQLSPRWLLSARVDWLDVSIDKYSGGLWNLQGLLHFQAWKNVGFSAGYGYFELNGDVEETDWRGGVNVDQHGPKAAIYVTF